MKTDIETITKNQIDTQGLSFLAGTQDHQAAVEAHGRRQGVRIVLGMDAGAYYEALAVEPGRAGLPSRVDYRWRRAVNLPGFTGSLLYLATHS